jgi:tetratricopeptide (TPR) repeat protein
MNARGQEPTADLRTALEQVVALLSRDPVLAERQALEILRALPDEPNALWVLAAAQRARGMPDAALPILERLAGRHAPFPQVQLELGRTLMDLNRPREAEAALERATALEHRLPVAWKALADLRSARGDEAGSQAAYEQYVNLTAGHPDLVRSAKLLFAGKLGQAEELCREFLAGHPTNVSAIRLLAEVGTRLGRLDDAEKLLRRCLELAPDFHLARNNYANVLYKKLQYEPALEEVEKAIAGEPSHPSHQLLKASILARIGETRAAIAIYEKLLADYPGQARTHLSLGHALKTVGRQADAIEAYREAIRARPGLGEAYWSLANLKTFRFGDADVALMQEQAALPHADPEDHFHLLFALGKAHEDRERFDEAFQFYSEGNALRRRTVRWDADDHHRNISDLKRFFDSGFFAKRTGQGCPAADPIFIVGLPRAGSTLLEQVLASHSAVEGTMELPDIIALARRLSGKQRKGDASRYPWILAELSPGQLQALGEEYLDRTRIHRSGLPHFIDKMPNNFAHVGLIHLILPNARIIDARRNPLACCFSGFKQLFASGQNFTYSLEEIGRYYRDYAELMEHWDKVLPGRVLRVQYERVVADPESQIRRLLEHCGLAFEPSCLEFHRTERAVRTASSEQVRRPLYGDAVDQWRHFEAHLGPLVDALGPAAACRDD